jgi:hypothetical protein
MLFFATHRLILILSLCVICNANVYANKAGEVSSDSSSLNVDSWTKNLQLIPLISYSPETNLALGAGANYVFNMPGTTPGIERTSYIQPSLVYTLNNQILFDVWGEILTKDEGYYADYQLSFWKFNEYYYGIGNSSREEDGELFDYTMINASVRCSKQLADRFFLGVQAEYYGMPSISPRLKDGMIANNLVTGSRGGHSIGVGFSCMYDKRDHLLTPTKDYYIELSNFWYGSIIGSQFNFSSYFFDARKYFALQESFIGFDAVLAFQGFGQLVTGDPPFKRMAEFGGQMIHRGYYTGRYRDLSQIGMQAEYRMGVWNRFGMTFFGAVGEVGRNLDSYKLNGLNFSYGLGLRYMMNVEERVNLRLDFGFVPGSTSPGIYLTLGEAF